MKIFPPIILLLLLTAAAFAQNRPFKKAVTVPASSYWAMPLSIADTFNIRGRFQARGGKSRDIEMYVMDAENFANWKNGQDSPTYYNSGRTGTAKFDVTLGQGKYYLILNNRFSAASNKAVTIIFQE